MEVGHIPSCESYTDVLIIGAGPSGLMAAQALARLGVRARIIDRREKGAIYGAADGFHPRTLEIWQSYGLLDELFRDGARLQAMIMCRQTDDGIERRPPNNTCQVESRYPFVVGCAIQTTERILRQSAEAHGVFLEQPVHPVSIEVQEQGNLNYPVAVTLERPPSGNDDSASTQAPHPPEKVHAKYVLAADGSHSWVRRALNIPMEGDDTEHVWGVIDADIVTDFPDWRFICMFQCSSGTLLYIPREHGLSRFYVQLSSEKFSRDPQGRLDKSKLMLDIVREYTCQGAREAMRPYNLQFTHVVWSTIFVVQHRLAAQFSFRNRVFIMGDAAHTHSPFGGQGANASMCDAHNLTWKVAYVLRGWAKPSILNTYEHERGKYAKDLIAFDKNATETTNGTHAADYSTLWADRNLYVSGMGVHYTSALSHVGGSYQNKTRLTVGMCLPSGAVLRLGDWLPMDIQDLAPSDGLCKLIVFAGDPKLPDDFNSLIEFANALQEELQPHQSKMLTRSTILNGQKKGLSWTDVPQTLQGWDRVFVDCPLRADGQHGTLYESIGIGADGVVVLVRPDGYVSVVTGVSRQGASEVTRVLSAL